MIKPIRIYLVRHGHAAQSWKMGTDAGLSETGRQQAADIAAQMDALGPLPIVTSPLRRARETAAAFERMWSLRARISNDVCEIPSPPPDTIVRSDWLKEKIAGSWTDLRHEILDGEPLGNWRDRVVASMLNLGKATIVATHYIAINAIVGAATNDDRVICFKPDNASCTVLDVIDKTLHLVKLGRETETATG
ncbi:MAG: histidine phosphatase family protein [Fimbriimonadaceae bacterium]|nr:histidine phosphatase family protein [Alphaproteobacteria bacterium]